MRRNESTVFHALLIGAWLPVLIVPFAWGAAWWAGRRAKITGSTLWARRLLALAIVDTLVAVAVFGFLASRDDRAMPALSRSEPAPYVVGLEILEEGAEGLRVRPVPGSPASDAGLQEGDVVLAVDDVAVTTADALIAAVSTSDEPRQIAVRRGSTTLEREVVPRRGTREGRVRAGGEGLFVPTRAFSPAECAEAETPTVPGLAGYALAIVLGLFLLFRIRGVGVARLALFAAVLVGSLASGAFARYAACATLEGHAPGTLLAGVLVSGLVLASGGFALARSAPKEAILAPLPKPRVVASALYYVFTWVPRAFVVSFGALAALRFLAQTGTPLDAFADLELGIGGVALLFAAVAVVGPLGEELYFRGALLPELGRVERPWVAIGLCSAFFGAMHVHHGLAIVGPFVIGGILSWARARTDSIAVPLGLHMAFNAGSLVLFVLLD